MKDCASANYHLIDNNIKYFVISNILVYDYIRCALFLTIFILFESVFLVL